MLVAPPPGITATASANCTTGSASVTGYPADENHIAYLTLTYGDDSVQTSASFQQTWNGSIPRPGQWPPDAVWWVAVSVDDAHADAFAAAHVPYNCLRPRAPQLFGSAGSGQVSLSWFQQGTLPVTDYLIEHSLDGNTWSPVNDGVSTLHTYTATNLANNVNHWFRVAAVGANGTGPYSNVGVFKPIALPSVPRSVTASAGPLSVLVKWQSSASGAPFEYRIESSTDRQTWTPRFAFGTNQLRIIGLTKGVRYYIRVSALNSGGFGPTSAVVSAVPLGPSAPLTPVDVTLSRAQTDGDAFVSVIPDYDGGRTIIKAAVRCTSSNGGATRTGSATGGSPYSVLVAGLTKLKTYRCSGTLSNRSGTSRAKTGSAFVMPVLPAAPTGVAVSTAGGIVNVNFKKLSGPNPISVYQATCTSSNGGFPSSSSSLASAAASIRVFGLSAGKRYTCRVTAFNLVGTGPASQASAAFTAP